MQRFGNLKGRLDAVERERSAARWHTALMLAGVLLVGAGLAYWFVGLRATQRGSEAVRLPPVLEKPASEARGDLALFGRALKELVTDCERRPGGSRQRVEKELDRRIERLSHLHKVGRELEPKLNREEYRVLMAMQNGERLVRQHLGCERSAGNTAASCDSGVLRIARAQIDRALALARGERFDDGDLILRAKGLVRLDAGAEFMEQIGDLRKAGPKMRLLGGSTGSR